MNEISCPKCGFEQDSGEECLQCGIIFAKYRSYESRALERPVMREEENKPSVGPLRKGIRVFRWISLAAGLLALILILRPAAPPEVKIHPGAGASFDRKMEVFQTRLASGGFADVSLTEAELNGWLDSNLILTPVEPAPLSPAKVRYDNATTAEAEEALQTGGVTREEMANAVREVRVALKEHTLGVYVRFNLYGKDMSFEIEGYPEIEDGYFRLEPTSGRLGSLPIPRRTLKSAARRIFESEENREKFRVPSHILRIGVSEGELSVVALVKR